MNQSHLLKQFQSQISKLESDMTALKSEISIRNRELTSKENSIRELKEKIKQLTTKDAQITISEHALLRYFERVLKFDLSTIQKSILTDSVLDLIEKLGSNGQYPVKEGGFSIVLKNNVITTIK